MDWSTWLIVWLYFTGMILAEVGLIKDLNNDTRPGWRAGLWVCRLGWPVIVPFFFLKGFFGAAWQALRSRRH